jgi:hypothetical protein
LGSHGKCHCGVHFVLGSSEVRCGGSHVRGGSGVLSIQVCVEMGMRGVSWYEGRRFESLPIPLWGCHEITDSLEHEAGSCLGKFLLRVAGGEIGAVIGIILRKTNVGQSDREGAADSLNTIDWRYCAMAFFQGRRSAVPGIIYQGKAVLRCGASSRGWASS